MNESRDYINKWITAWNLQKQPKKANIRLKRSDLLKVKGLNCW